MSYTPVTDVPADSETPFPIFGPTSARPTNPAVTQFYWDTTLDEPIWWNGSEWIDAAGVQV
jgi:hypothetical protein